MCKAKIKLAGLTTALDFYGTATSENVNYDDDDDDD